ncbi:MAG: phage portal protein [Candidatus Komeilibacteria bacterium]|nr:phage portal protein [Candidatus Komeilibacteria bacterium]
MQILKTIKNFFKAKSYTGLINDWSGEEQAWDGKNFLTAYKSSLPLNRALNKRAEKVSEIEFILRRGEQVLDKADNNPWLQLLRRPNQFLSGRQFFHLYQRYFDLWGEVYIWKQPKDGRAFNEAKSIEALHLFNPTTMSYVVDDSQGITKYIRRLPNSREQEYTPDEIIRDFNPSMDSPLKAESLILSGIKAISTEIQLAEYQANILKNGGRIGGVFKFKTERLTKQQLSELKDNYDEQFAEARKSGKPLFLGGDSDYSNTALTPEELGFIESKKMTLNDICILTSVPKPLLSSLDEIKFDNADAAIKIFLKETIAPLMKRLVNKLNWDLIPAEFELDFVNPVPEDRNEIRQDLAAASASYALTTNEKREMLKLDPVDGGDEILIPFGLGTLGDAVNPANADPAAQKGFRKGYEHPLRDEFIRRKYWDFKTISHSKREKEFTRVLNKYFKGQEERLLNGLKSAKSLKKKSLIDERFDKADEVKLAINLFLPFLQKYLVESGEETMNFIGYKDFDFVFSSQIASWLNEKVSKSSWEIADTTLNKLQDEFAASLEAGEGRDGLVKRIQNVYGDISKSRAETIARTEIGGVTSKGTFEAYRQAQIPTKIWVWSAGARGGVRPEHQAIDGEEVPLDHPFSNGLQYPGDPSADPEETVNCQCQI